MSQRASFVLRFLAAFALVLTVIEETRLVGAFLLIALGFAAWAAGRRRLGDAVPLLEDADKQVLESDLSSSLGPRERHLRRRRANLLFPASRREVTVGALMDARLADTQEVVELAEATSELLRGVVDGPEVVEMDAIKVALEDAIALCGACTAHGSADALNAAAAVRQLFLDLSAAARSAADRSPAMREACREWLDAESARMSLAQDRVLCEVMRVPQEDMVSTICTLEPGMIRHVAGLLSDAWQTVSSSCVAQLQAAMAEGYPLSDGSARIEALGGVRQHPENV